jgi:hypothetical protein
MGGASEVSIVSALLKCLKSGGFDESSLRLNLISLACDGASVMLGKKAGVAAKLTELYPHLITWHCMNHRLELAVSDSVSEVTAINHFKIFLDSIYCLYHQSPKNQRELQACAESLESQIARIGRVLDVRWVSSSFRTVKAVWTSFEALHLHFTSASNDMTRDSKERSKYRGLLLRLASPEFLCDLGLLYDVLHELTSLSLGLQKRSVTLPQAEQLIKRTVRVLMTFKEQPGEKLEEALTAASRGSYNGVSLITNNKIRQIHRGQFIQSLVNNMNQRLTSIATVTPGNGQALSQFFTDVDVLDVNKWPSSVLSNSSVRDESSHLSIRYGEKEIKRLCARLRLNADEALNGMRECIDRYILLQQQHQLVSDGPSAVKATFAASDISDLQPLVTCINTLPVSTAECERNFSSMNLICTSQRNSLLTTTISNIMMISINGPPVTHFKPEKYLKSWLAKHRSADDTRSRKIKRQTQTDSRDQLWQLL